MNSMPAASQVSALLGLDRPGGVGDVGLAGAELGEPVAGARAVDGDRHVGVQVGEGGADGGRDRLDGRRAGHEDLAAERRETVGGSAGVGAAVSPVPSVRRAPSVPAGGVGRVGRLRSRRSCRRWRRRRCRRRRATRASAIAPAKMRRLEVFTRWTPSVFIGVFTKPLGWSVRQRTVGSPGEHAPRARHEREVNSCRVVDRQELFTAFSSAGSMVPTSPSERRTSTASGDVAGVRRSSGTSAPADAGSNASSGPTRSQLSSDCSSQRTTSSARSNAEHLIEPRGACGWSIGTSTSTRRSDCAASGRPSR